MLLANFNGKEHLRHRAVSLRQHGFLVFTFRLIHLFFHIFLIFENTAVAFPKRTLTSFSQLPFMRYVTIPRQQKSSTFSMSEPVAWISVLSFQTVVVRILHFVGLVHRPTLPTYIVRAVVVCCILDQESAIRSQVVSKIADLKVKKTYEMQIRQIVPNGEIWT